MAAMSNSSTPCLNSTGDNWTRLNDSFPWNDYILCLLIVVAIVGNGLVIYIQGQTGAARIGGANATNRLIIGLAVADLLTAVFIIPIPEYVNVPRNTAGEFYCRFIEPFSLAWIFFMASVYTLTTISIERYIAIAYPLHYKIWVHRNHVVYAFAAIWLSASVINAFSFFFHAVGECGRCISTYPSVASRRVNGFFLFLIEYVGPLCIMCFTNYKSISILRRDDNGKGGYSTAQQKLRRRLTLMFAVIVVAFMVLWLPDQLAFFLYNMGVLDDEYTNSVVYHFFLKIALLNSAVTNPLMYSAWMPVFRRSVKALLCCRGMDNVNRETKHDVRSESSSQQV